MPQTFVKVLKEVGKLPVITDAVISNLQKNGSDIQIKGTWSFKNYNNNESNTVNDFYVMNTNTNSIHSLPPTVQDKRIILSTISSCYKKSAYLFQDDDCCYVNVISDGGETISINVKDEEAHGKVYKDANLSSFSWSPDGQLLVYVAEKFRPKTSSFLSRKSDAKGKGDKYAYIDDWGEQMEGQSQSVVVVINPSSEEIKVLDLPEGLCGGQVVWTPQADLLGVAFVTDPFRLGLIYCPNRESILFQLNLGGKFSELSPRGGHVQSPRFSPDGTKLAFLRGPVGGPHVRGAQLCLLKWNKDTKPTVVVDYVATESPLSGGRSFPGLYGTSVLPLACWTADSERIVVSTPGHFALGTYVVNTETKTIAPVPLEGALLAHDVRGDFLLASLSTLTAPTRLLVLRLHSLPSQTVVSNATFLNSPSAVEGIPDQWHRQWTFKNPNPHPRPEVSDSPVPAIYFGPSESTAGVGKRPLIVWIHGGPHAMIQNQFTPAASFFVRLGYSVLFPNYRGSLGQGTNALESLPGNCGTTDADDVFQATLQCLERYKSVLDESRVVLYGGSHGGFLVTHLSAQHPELYKAVSTRNPVIDISTQTIMSDIPDWCFVECGLDYEIGKSVSGEILSLMHGMSPLSLVNKVTAPTLVMLGNQDRRVPMSQGIFYYKALLARKIKTKLFIYHDSHALAKVDETADCLIQTALWFREHL